MENKYYRKPKYSLLQQRVALLSAYKDGECQIDKTSLFWFGKIQPTPLSKEYKIVLSYKLGEPPKVWLLGDELEKLDHKDFPHKYEVDIEKKMVRICLYRHREFSAYKLLANTIIPWTVEWLYYYELWLATGGWLGGGEHPRSGNEKLDKSD